MDGGDNLLGYQVPGESDGNVVRAISCGLMPGTGSQWNPQHEQTPLQSSFTFCDVFPTT